AQRAVSGSKDYFEVMETRPAYAPIVSGGSRPTRISIDEGRPVVAFEDVSFSYDGKDQVLDGVGFEVGRGERVALVGESGGGKSTIVNLLLG
ncbi:ATP-binding cassette domain-containing protein, partial [Enterococcus faecium]